MREMTDEFALRPSITFAKRMKGVQLAEIICGTETECGGGKSGEMPLLRKLSEDRRGCAVNVGIMGKPIASFADVDGSQLPGPVVHIAEKEMVNRL
jgi:hypothetical protein